MNKIINKKGSYGFVRSLSDSKIEYYNLNPNKEYVIKDNIKEKHISGINSIKEIDILMKGWVHPNIVKLIHIDYDTDNIDRDPAKLIFEKANFDLREKINLNPKYSASQFKLIMLDLLSAVKYLHTIRIIHRDIKPENILIYENYIDNKLQITAKLCDFGMSTYYDKSNNFSPKKTTYMYAPPEVLLGKTDYNYNIDIWSLGCVFYEIIAKKSYLPNQKEVRDEINYYLNHIFYRCEESLTRDVIEDIYGEDSEFIKFGEWSKQWISNKKSVKNETKKFKIEHFFGFSKNDINKIECSIWEDERYGRFVFGSFSEFCSLLREMLNIRPLERFNIDDCISHEFFNVHSLECIIKPKNINFFEKEIRIKASVKRSEVLNYLKIISHEFIIYNSLDHVSRIMFHTIDLFDRYMHINNSFVYDGSSERIVLLCCLYIYIKHAQVYEMKSHVWNKIITILSLQNIKELKNIIEDLEIKFCDRINWSIFNFTIYELNLEKEDTIMDTVLLDKIIFLKESYKGTILELYHNILLKSIEEENKNIEKTLSYVSGINLWTEE